MQSSKFLFLIIACALLCSTTFAQPYMPAKGKVFNDSIVARVDVLIHPDSLAEIFSNVFSDHEFPATFIFNDGINTDTVLNVGFRLRGNTSRTSAKKSFKVSFNTFVQGQKFDGIEKMNLNGEHNDPSIIRAKLFWDTAQRLRIPLCRSNHVELYINSTYYGLYINVEHIDENFVKHRYLNNWGNFYKCLYPADLAYLGSNPNSYKITSGSRRVYELKINEDADDYTDLRDFITALSFGAGTSFQSNLENVFNVNSFLRMYAFDVLTGNWDNYAGNMNNYYLYHDIQTNKINYLPYDVDNSYGIDWLGYDWGLRYIYNWEVNSSQRQLITRLFAQQDYLDRFSFFMNKMIQGAASSAAMFPLIDSIKTLISPFVVNDTFHTLDYGYTYNDFLNSYTQSSGGHVDYGLKPYIIARNNNSATQLVLNNVAPVFSETRHVPYTPYASDSIFIKSWVEDENIISNVFLNYKINSAGNITTILMYDDALHNDDNFNDEIFGAYITPQQTGDTIFYFLENTDAQGNIGREPRFGFNKIIIEAQPQLFINELMAKNTSTVADNFGNYDDWFEIYNAAIATDLHRFFVTDDFSKPDKWNMGDTSINTNGFLLCWADEESYQGKHHANFKLRGNGEQLAITEFNGISYRFLDSLSFGLQSDDVSIGCYPDGIKPIVALLPVTPGYSNVVSGITNQQNNFDAWYLFPNPAQDFINVITKKPTPFLLTDVQGRVLSEMYFSKNINSINLKNYERGIYFLLEKSSGLTIKFAKF